MSRKVPFPSLQLQKPFSGKGNKNQRSLWADLLSHTVWLLAVEQQEEKKEAFSIQCQGIKGIWDELTDYFVTEFLNKVKSCELEQLTDGLETQLSVVLYMNSNKVAVKEADCAPADLPRAWQNGSLVFIGALGHKWHSTCCTSGNAGDNKTSFWKAFQKTLFPFDWLISDWLQHKNFIEKVWIRWGYNPIQSGLMPAHPFDSSETWVAAWWGICSLNSQGLQLLHTLVSDFMSWYTKKFPELPGRLHWGSQHSSSLLPFQVMQNTLKINSRFGKVALHVNSHENQLIHENLACVNPPTRSFRKKPKIHLFQSYWNVLL